MRGAVNSLSDSVVTCDIGRWIEQSGVRRGGVTIIKWIRILELCHLEYTRGRVIDKNSM